MVYVDHPWAAEPSPAAASRDDACSPTGAERAGRDATPREALWLQTELTDERRRLLGTGQCHGDQAEADERHPGAFGGACKSWLGEGAGHWPSFPKRLPDSMFINRLAREVGRGRDEGRGPAPGGS